MKNAGVWGGIAVLIYSVVIFYQSLSLDYYNKLGPGPGFFPRWLSCLLIILSLLYIWQSAKKEIISTSDMLPKDKKARQGIISTVASVLLFILGVPFTGFVVPSTVSLFVMLIRDYKWYKALIASVAASIILLLVFQKLLGVTLPVNDFGW